MKVYPSNVTRGVDGKRNWVRGRVSSTTKNTKNANYEIQLGTLIEDYYSVRDVPWKEKHALTIGDDVTLYFSPKNKYYAINLTNNTLAAIRDNYDLSKRGWGKDWNKTSNEKLEPKPGLEKIKNDLKTENREGAMKTKKTIEDFQKAVEELEPFFGQAVLDKLSQADRKELRGLFERSLEHSIRLVNITATYDDTKKSPEDLLETVIEVAAAVVVLIDGNTTQIIKKGLPKSEVKAEPA